MYNWIIWAIGWPFMCTVATYFHWLYRDKPNYESFKVVAGVNGLINTAIWIIGLIYIT